MVTVPSCARCQREKSYGDDDLRDFVNLDWAGSQHPDAPEQVEKIARATLLERSKFGRAFQRGGQEQDLTTKSGLYLGEAFAVPIDNADLLKTMEYIVRDLYSEEMREPLPELTPVAVKYVPPLEAHELLVNIRVLPHRGPTVKGNLVA